MPKFEISNVWPVHICFLFRVFSLYIFSTIIRNFRNFSVFFFKYLLLLFYTWKRISRTVCCFVCVVKRVVICFQMHKPPNIPIGSLEQDCDMLCSFPTNHSVYVWPWSMKTHWTHTDTIFDISSLFFFSFLFLRKIKLIFPLYVCGSLHW